MLHAFLLTQSGIPVLYSGDEIGQTNDYTYHDDPLKADDSRYLHRGDLPWKDVRRRTRKGTRPYRVYSRLMKLEALRKENDVFENDADTWLLEPYNDHVLGIGRYYKKQKLIALFNFSEEMQTAWINEPEEYENLLTGKKQKAQGVTLAGYDFVWLMTKF